MSVAVIQIINFSHCNLNVNTFTQEKKRILRVFLEIISQFFKHFEGYRVAVTQMVPQGNLHLKLFK